MESRLDLENDQVVITLSNGECLSIADGHMVSDRNNPFDPMAKVEVAPFAQLDPTYEAFDPSNNRGDGLFKAFSRVACKAIVLGNNDIRVFVPRELVAYTFFSAETIAADRIEGNEDVKPKGGVRIEFSSSLK